MIRPELVYDRAALIDRALHRLEQFKNMPLPEFVQDPDNYAIAEHHLRLSLEAVFDIGRHILVKNGLGKPGDYREILILLERSRIIPLEFMEKIKGMAGYRNRLVHMYNKISREELYDLIINKLEDIKALTSYLLEYARLNEQADNKGTYNAGGNPDLLG